MHAMPRLVQNFQSDLFPMIKINVSLFNIFEGINTDIFCSYIFCSWGYKSLQSRANYPFCPLSGWPCKHACIHAMIQKVNETICSYFGQNDNN